MPHDPERFIALACRELGAAEVHIVEPGPSGAPDAPDLSEGPAGLDPSRQVWAAMVGGRFAVATFEVTPPGPGTLLAKQRRLEMLAAAFDAVAVEEHPTRRSRPPPAASLREELEALCARAVAVNALVVDANSPVVWGAAYGAGIVEVPPLPSSPTLAGSAAADAAIEGPAAAVSRRALRVVRGLPELAALRRGKPLRYVERSGEGPVVAHAFASIYLLVVVFEPGSSFDELRAERAIVESLPRVERLVMALPPHDPEPTQGAGAVAMRRPRRR